MIYLAIIVLFIVNISSYPNISIARMEAKESDDTDEHDIQPIYFQYANFKSSDAQTSLDFLYEATVDNITDYIVLTYPMFIPGDTYGIHRGQLMYSQAVQFLGQNPITKKQTSASFSVSFSFRIKAPFQEHKGEGFIYFMIADPTLNIKNGQPLYFGVFPATDCPTRVIAIEYDTYKNAEVDDPDDNHIGIDIDSAKSIAVGGASTVNVSISDSNWKYNWIDYHDLFKQIEVRISNHNIRPINPLLLYRIDLQRFYTETMYVGFSAETYGEYAQKLDFKQWSFSTILEPPHTYPPPPAGQSNTGLSPYADFNVTTWIQRSILFGKLVGGAIALIFFIILVCGLIIGFTQFGFTCIASQEDLIELERDPLGDFGRDESEDETKTDFEKVKEKLDIEKSQTEEKPEVESSPLMLNNLHFQFSAEKKQEYDEDHKDGQAPTEDAIFRRGSLWGFPEASNPEDIGDDKLENDQEEKEVSQSIQRKKESKSSMKSILKPSAIVKFFRRQSKREKLEVLDMNDKSNAYTGLKVSNEKEQIALLIKEAATVDLEELVEAHRFQYKELNEATDGFAGRNKLGESVKGSMVYKGYVVNSGIEVAIKILNIESKSNFKLLRAELSNLSHLRRTDLAQLVGWCKHKGKCYIVYEFFSGLSLDKILFLNTHDEMKFFLSWDNRFKIIKAIAVTLQYLHHGWKWPIIHRNVKSSSVMLKRDNEKIIMKLVDYGVDWLMSSFKEEQVRIEQEESGDENEMKEDLMEVPSKAKSYGFFAPEIISDKITNEYTDIYAFGMLIIEIACLKNLEDDVTGYENQVFFDSLLKSDKEKKLVEVVREDFDTTKNDAAATKTDRISQIELVIDLGLMCIEVIPTQRPTMKQIVQCLMGEIPFPPFLSTETSQSKGLHIEDDIVDHYANITELDSYRNINKSQDRRNSTSIIKVEACAPTVKSTDNASGIEEQIIGTMGSKSINFKDDKMMVSQYSLVDTLDYMTNRNLCEDESLNIEKAKLNDWIDIDIMDLELSMKRPTISHNINWVELESLSNSCNTMHLLSYKNSVDMSATNDAHEMVKCKSSMPHNTEHMDISTNIDDIVRSKSSLRQESMEWVDLPCVYEIKRISKWSKRAEDAKINSTVYERNPLSESQQNIIWMDIEDITIIPLKSSSNNNLNIAPAVPATWPSPLPKLEESFNSATESGFNRIDDSSSCISQGESSVNSNLNVPHVVWPIPLPKFEEIVTVSDTKQTEIYKSDDPRSGISQSESSVNSNLSVPPVVWPIPLPKCEEIVTDSEQTDLYKSTSVNLWSGLSQDESSLHSNLSVPPAVWPIPLPKVEENLNTQLSYGITDILPFHVNAKYNAIMSSSPREMLSSPTFKLISSARDYDSIFPSHVASHTNQLEVASCFPKSDSVSSMVTSQPMSVDHITQIKGSVISPNYTYPDDLSSREEESFAVNSNVQTQFPSPMWPIPRPLPDSDQRLRYPKSSKSGEGLSPGSNFKKPQTCSEFQSFPQLSGSNSTSTSSGIDLENNPDPDFYKSSSCKLDVNIDTYDNVKPLSQKSFPFDKYGENAILYPSQPSYPSSWFEDQKHKCDYPSKRSKHGTGPLRIKRVKARLLNLKQKYDHPKSKYVLPRPRWPIPAPQHEQ